MITRSLWNLSRSRSTAAGSLWTACGFGPIAFVVTGGLLIWVVDFVFSYGFAAIACARGFAQARWLGIGVVPLVVWVATAVALTALAALMRQVLQPRVTSALAANDPIVPQTTDPAAPNRARAEEPEATLRFVAAAVGLLALIGIGWNALPVALVTPQCR